MSSSPLFSIILPTYNRASLLKRAISSVLSQSFSDWELWVVDDGSTDETEAIVLAISDSRIHYCKLDHGERSHARNQGVLRASGQYICFLDDDDTYGQDYLLGFYNYLSSNHFPDLIVRTGYYRVNGEKRNKTELYNKSRHKNPVRFAAFHFCGVWSLCIPKIFLNTDFFHEEFPHWQDTHLILRLLARHPFIQLVEYQYYYHLHPDMGSKKMGHDIEKKLSLNLLPIEHIYEKYSYLLKPFLPAYTRRYLISKKYLEFAQVAFFNHQFKLGKKYFWLSLKTKVSKRFWRHYAYLCKILVSMVIPGFARSK